MVGMSPEAVAEMHASMPQTERGGFFRPLETGQYHTRKNFSGPNTPNTDGTGYVQATPQVFNGAFGAALMVLGLAAGVIPANRGMQYLGRRRTFALFSGL